MTQHQKTLAEMAPAIDWLRTEEGYTWLNRLTSRTPGPAFGIKAESHHLGITEEMEAWVEMNYWTSDLGNK